MVEIVAFNIATRALFRRSPRICLQFQRDFAGLVILRASFSNSRSRPVGAGHALVSLGGHEYDLVAIPPNYEYRLMLNGLDQSTEAPSRLGRGHSLQVLIIDRLSEMLRTTCRASPDRTAEGGCPHIALLAYLPYAALAAIGLRWKV